MIQILQGNCSETLLSIPEGSVNCCVTSPPYWGLRDYKVPPSEWTEIKFVPMAGMPEVTIQSMRCCLGLEADPNAFVGHIVHVFRQLWRVLRDDATCWVNFGDSYATGAGKGRNDTDNKGNRGTEQRDSIAPNRMPINGVKSKDLMGMPWRVAFALHADGWYLRSDIVWHKPNPMPESVYDRPTKSHEYIFLLTKSPKYFYDADAIKESVTGTSYSRGNGVNPKAKIHSSDVTEKQNASFSAAVCGLVSHRNKRSVWTVATEPFRGAHFATFPTELIRPCILAGTKPGDTVIDPFGGSGTTGAVAIELGRKAILCELNPNYIELINQRTQVTIGMPL